MDRILMEKLKEWKNKTNRKPLIIRGARQVGKTWIMKEFGKQCYSSVAYINFDNNSRMKRLFDDDFDIKRILTALEIEIGYTIDADNTLIIFDEIQEAPGALGSLKYFQENAPEYHIIAAGSLLGVAMHRGTSFPVGKVEFLELFPLNFFEFLKAIGENKLCELLISGDNELITVFKTKYIRRLKEYYFVGGMPEVVQAFIDNNDFIEIRNIQKRLLSYYEQDFSKHAETSIVPRMNLVWSSIPRQLAKENKKFIFGMVKEGSRAKDFERAIQWLIDSGLVTKVNRITKPAFPLKAYEDMDAYKLFMLDIGLLLAMTDIGPKIILEGNEIFTEFKGAVTEQYVFQQLVSHVGITPFYYSTPSSSGEIDFIIQGKEELIPIEVKAEENLKAKSLKAFYEKYKPQIAVRTSMSDYRKQEWMVNIPLYAFANMIEKLC